MAQSIFIALAATLLLSTFSRCSAENVYCVRPTQAPNTSCSSCPHSNTPCATLSEYAQDAEQYFTSNTTMVFLPGNHTLDVNFTVANISRLTLCGQSSLSLVTTVVCNGAVGFSFMSIFDFQIHSVSFTSCGRNFGSAEVSKYALLLESIEFAELVNTSFHDNLGTALVTRNTNIALADNTFTHNHCDQEGIVPGTTCMGGGGISALDSSLTLTGNTSFLQNDATFGSAGIHVTNCSLTSTGDIYFTDNSNIASASDETLAAAAILASSSSLSFTGTSNFTNNFATSGGAIYIEYTTLAFTGTTNFINNSASSGSGGAIGTRYNVSLSFNGTTNFIHNLVQCEPGDYGGGGGAIFANLSSTLSFTGTSNFIDNSVEFCDGGAIYVHADTWSFTGISNFIRNSASFGRGGAIYVYANTLSFTGTSNFSYNTASLGSGGAIYVNTNALLSFNGATHVISNSLLTGGGDGGAIYAGINTSLSFTGTSSFINNSADCQPSYNGGGAIFANLNSVLIFSGTSIFIANSVDYCDGGAMYIDASILSFTGTSNFSDNTVSIGSGGAIYVNTNASMSFSGTTNVISNYVDLGGDGGAIYANVNTSLSFTGTVSFINNSAASLNGGGVNLMRNSILSILPNATVYWENNHARLGGAIYVDDQSNPFVYCTQIDTCKVKDKCFFQLPGQNLSSGIDARFVFKDNSADVAGSVLYGGAIDNCKLTGLDPYHSGDVFDMLVYIEDDNKTSSISSDIFRVCPCENKVPYCSYSEIIYVLYPGETFRVSVVAVGQRNGAVPASVISHLQGTNTQSKFSNLHGSSTLQPFQYVQATNNTCTTLNYTVSSLSVLTEHLELFANGPCSTFGNGLVLSIEINQTCPPGFDISKEKRSCVCNERLTKYTNSCDITDGLGQITRDFHQHFWVGYDPSHGLILHPHCPLDYCVPHTVEFPLNDTRKQCDHDRSSLLCGACQVNYSLVLGTSQCKQCTNSYLLLLIPFALMGLALVLFLLVFKLTVATGTLSGLVFYANIVGVNRTIFLRGGTTNVLSVFIAWLNLDFGIESCFYNGMDAYSKTWLQFVFPVYIWVLVGLLILVSHFSHRFAKLLGNNPVSVLATLILLSYTKILRTLITALYVTYLEYPSYNRKVWLYDANIDYLSGKHIPLFLVAVLVFLFLFLPYTLLLLFGQWLQAISHLRAFAWVNNSRLKPFIDSYHAPYKPKYRYWPGMLLVLRIILLLIFAFNPQENPSINLLAIQVGSGVLLVWAWFSGGVYRKWYLDTLESLFALNLIILAGCTYHVNLSGGNQLAAGYTSVTIALVLFIVILTYHIFLRIGGTKQCKNLNLESRLPKFKNTNAVSEPINNAEVVENFSQLREPLLDDSPKPTYSAF